MGVYAIKENKKTPVKEKTVITYHPTDKKTADLGDEQISKLVEETFSLSKVGKVPNIPFVSGKTAWQEVNKKWGKSDSVTEAAKGRYEGYESHQSTIGYAGKTVNDLRSYDSELQKISLNDIKKVGGEPDAIRYYKDKTHNQMILVYHASTSTELLWVLSNTTEQEPNPKVDHISLYTKIDQQAHVGKQPEVTLPSEVVSKMSLEEKIGQMILAGISGTTMDANTKKLVNQFHIGGIIFYKNNLDNSYPVLILYPL